MNKGSYIVLSGAVLKNRHMELTAQNMANAATNGYKKDRIAFKHLMSVNNKPPVPLDGRRMTELGGIVTDFSKGTTTHTGNPLDIAINGDGFFTLEDNLYTRNGNFTLDSEGLLITHGGVKVLGDGGPIEIPPGSVDITSSGEILVDNVSVGKLKVVDFNDKSVLTKAGEGNFKSRIEGEEIETSVSQGYLEGSNVDMVREMVQMISTMREFESYQKMLHAFDEAETKILNELAK